MAQGITELQPGTLWTRVKERTQYALQCGALQPIPTQYEFVEQDGVNFLVRILANLARKEQVKQKQEKAQKKDVNPFLPYDPDLFVADISKTHLCLLNKYNAVDYHLLIVTRAFEDQETWLNQQDFEAMWAVLAEIDGLMFYNAGKTAGASQRHKHLQMIPLPLVPEGPSTPIESVLASAQFNSTVGTTTLPFVHAFGKLFPNNSLSLAAEATLECYRTLLQAVGLLSNTLADSEHQSGAYNLLVTRQWMLVIPRSQESFASIPVNSLGFAGALFVRNEEQMKTLKDYGPMTILQHVALPEFKPNLKF